MKKIITLLAGLAMVACTSDNPTPDTSSLVLPGDPVPSFTISDTLGQNTITSPASFIHPGRATLIYLFSPTCADCKMQTPAVMEAWKTIKVQSNAYALVCIARGDGGIEITRKSAIDYWQTAGAAASLTTAEAPALYYDQQRQIYGLFAKSTVPRFYVVSPEGIITWKFAWSGAPLTKGQLLDQLSEALK